MTKENAHLYLPIVQALADGKEIEINEGTVDLPIWNQERDWLLMADPDRYRIKPEPPKPREWKASVVTAACQRQGNSTWPVGTIVKYDKGDENKGFEIVTVREVIE